MRPAARLAILTTFVMTFAIVPAIAQGAPAICQGRNIPLKTDVAGNPIEQLVEHHLYFHGEQRPGNADAVQDFNDAVSGGAPSRLLMSSTAPTGADDKVFVHNSGAGQWQTNYAMAPALAHWSTALDVEQRIVCAQAVAYAMTDSGALDVQLWADKALAETGPVVTKAGTGGTANQTSKYTANFGKVDFTASFNLIVQLAGPSTNALVSYDSTASPGELTYVTVEPL
jgi:hypothetical protein